MRLNIRFINSSSHIKLCEFNWSYNEVTHSESLHRGYLVVRQKYIIIIIIIESFFCTLWTQTVLFLTRFGAQTATQIAHENTIEGTVVIFFFFARHETQTQSTLDRCCCGWTFCLPDGCCLPLCWLYFRHPSQRKHTETFWNRRGTSKKKKNVVSGDAMWQRKADKLDFFFTASHPS